MHLLVTRSPPDGERQADELRARGHEVLIEPLLQVDFLDVGRLPLKGVQALIATSRNGLRALARNEALGKAKKLPIFVVGPGTAAMAAALGFTDIRQGEGTADSLGELIARESEPGKGVLLHLAGERLAVDLKGDLEARDFNVDQPKLYRTLPAHVLSRPLRKIIASGDLDAVLLMSPLTARTWADLLIGAGLSEAALGIRHYCLSPAVGDGLAGLGAVAVDIADTPNENSLLALVARKTAH